MEAIQIVESNSNGISLNEKVLQSLLSTEEIKDRYISVISITGAFREGKSFLLNFLLRYLKIRYLEMRNVSDWLKPEDGPLNGFSFAPGSKRHTSGIMMWPDIFMTETSAGEKVAIIVLDTQGSFDNQSTMDDCSKIFAISTLISSLQVYNVMRNIKQSDLMHLQCFGGYGNMFGENEETAFQNLRFLVRDWACGYEHPYGLTGGAAYLAEVFHSDKPELNTQIESIKGLFNKIDCFLMPYPGRTVDVGNKFDGDLNDVDDTFRQHVQDFVSHILSPENLVLKSINGDKIKAGDFIYYIQEYSNVLKDGSLPEAETYFKATVEAQHKAAYQKALKIYVKSMDLDVKHEHKFSGDNEFYGKHAKLKVECVKHYENLKKIRDEVVYDKYLVLLKNKMDEKFPYYVTINKEKREKFEEERKKRITLEEERKKRIAKQAEQMRQRTRDQPGTSGLGQLNTAETVGLAATIIGGAAVLAFGASKLFGSRGNND